MPDYTKVKNYIDSIKTNSSLKESDRSQMIYHLLLLINEYRENLYVNEVRDYNRPLYKSGKSQLLRFLLDAYLKTFDSEIHILPETKLVHSSLFEPKSILKSKTPEKNKLESPVKNVIIKQDFFESKKTISPFEQFSKIEEKHSPLFKMEPKEQHSSEKIKSNQSAKSMYSQLSNFSFISNFYAALFEEDQEINLQQNDKLKTAIVDFALALVPKNKKKVLPQTTFIADFLNIFGDDLPKMEKREMANTSYVLYKKLDEQAYKRSLKEKKEEPKPKKSNDEIKEKELEELRNYLLSILVVKKPEIFDIFIGGLFKEKNLSLDTFKFQQEGKQEVLFNQTAEKILAILQKYATLRTERGDDNPSEFYNKFLANVANVKAEIDDLNRQRQTFQLFKWKPRDKKRDEFKQVKEEKQEIPQNKGGIPNAPPLKGGIPIAPKLPGFNLPITNTQGNIPNAPPMLSNLLKKPVTVKPEDKEIEIDKLNLDAKIGAVFQDNCMKLVIDQYFLADLYIKMLHRERNIKTMKQFEKEAIYNLFYLEKEDKDLGNIFYSIYQRAITYVNKDIGYGAKDRKLSQAVEKYLNILPLHVYLVKIKKSVNKFIKDQRDKEGTHYYLSPQLFLLEQKWLEEIASSLNTLAVIHQFNEIKSSDIGGTAKKLLKAV